MAPVKRSTTTTQRETRATRAATIAKKQDGVLKKQTATATSTKSNLAPSTALTTTRRRKQAVEDEQPAESLVEDAAAINAEMLEHSKSVRAKSAKAAIPSTGLAAAPRRRLKVTPLNAPKEDVPSKESGNSESKDTNLSRKPSTRSKTSSSVPSEPKIDEAPPAEPKTRSARKVSSKLKDEQDNKELKATKTRSRSKAQKAETVEEQQAEPEQPVTSRATRSQRADSAAFPQAPCHATETTSSKSSAGVRKKVTFQDLPNDNDKENQPLPSSKSKKGTTQRASQTTTPVTGLRAKPLRKAVAASNTSRGRKITSTAKTAIVEESAHDLMSKQAKQPRALTPKKITQVAKSASPEHENEDMSEGEDELSGGKTPARDLSVSPRRPPTAALAKALSPAKKLDFGQSLLPKSPDRTAVFRDPEADRSGFLASPARRPAVSQFKDSLKESPKRGLTEGVNILFPNQAEPSASILSNMSTSNIASQTMSNMLQSPKRVGTLDATFFSQSAVKKATVSKSPFKASLFGTPAKRLFSPAKKSPARFVQEPVEPEKSDTTGPEPDQIELEEEITASSHFRSSVSPLRVMRVEPDVADLDFDDSILQVRSPLKAQKSPQKGAAHGFLRIAPEMTDISPKCGMILDNKVVGTIEPSPSDMAHGHCQDSDEQTETPFPEFSKNHESESNFSAQHNAKSIEKELSPRPAQPKVAFLQPLSKNLFRSPGSASDEDSSEDELAGGKTPARPLTRSRPSLTADQIRSRLSAGMPKNISSTGYGFTPLAAQISGWLATSPEKSQEEGHDGFSPLARQHIDGEIIVSRNSTPVQKLSDKVFVQPVSLTNSVLGNRKSTDMRKSMAQRQSLGLFGSSESPARNPQFEELMEIRAMEEQAASESADQEFTEELSNEESDHISGINDEIDLSVDHDETILDDDAKLETEQQVGDLTTDLINFTHASDTAMIDFQKLAEEAEDLASEGAEPLVSEQIIEVIQNAQEASTDIISENVVADTHIESAESQTVPPSWEDSVQEAQSPLLQPVDRQLESPSVLNIGEDESPAISPSSGVYSSAASPALTEMMRTPQPNLRLDDRRLINTVVSKIPLKPEGITSPIKMTRKRARSFGNADASPAKRMSFENLRQTSLSKAVTTVQSPDRGVRTSGAPSPGGTSTPATCKSNGTHISRYSLATPGQTSFVIDDFGDSTLDGIELPNDFDQDFEFEGQEMTPARSAYATVCTPSATTPKTVLEATTMSTKRSARRATTPMTVTKKTPKTARKTPARVSAATAVERTPLSTVGKGVLHGASVFVDVHTSEGADASGIFIELLSQMGARCLREWRWNPRANLAPDAENEAIEQKIGITHVVFKDGSKRTLEKVRDAKSEVCCVGVTWVLDCERENKWLDESSYTIDTSVLPRGGSNRRKSMEPKALLVGNDGSVSTSRPRRSVSAEMAEIMKRELAGTPARGPKTSPENEDEDVDENDENIDQATPTGFVSYDPRIAMTPGTPYLVSQGKKLTQMSAPPKQQNKSLFEDEDEENDDTFLGGDHGAVKDAKKFRMKNLGAIAKRRRTLGWKPNVGSPLGRS